MHCFQLYSLPIAPICTEKVALIDFRDNSPVLEIGRLSFPMQIVQKVAATKGLRCIYFLFGSHGYPEKTLTYIGRTENLRDRLYQYPHNESKLVGYIETKLSRKDMTWIEDYLIYRLNPVWNSRYNITTNWQCCILKPSTLEFL
jgi:hypothetical protein